MKNKTLFVPRLDIPDTLPPEEAAGLVCRDGTTESIGILNWEAFPYAPESTVSAAHDGKNLYLFFRVKGDRLLAIHDKEQSAVCDDSCVEVFLKPESSDYYWNFEFNCIGAINAARRLSRNEFTPVDKTGTQLIRRYGTYVGHAPFAEGVKEGEWNIFVILPLNIIGVDATEGETVLKGNFYSCSSGATTEYYLTWNPIKTPEPDYHRPEFFGTIILK